MRSKSLYRIAYAISLYIGLSNAVNASVSYNLVVLGNLGGGFTVPKDINNSGQITGDSAVSGVGYYHAFVTDATNGTLRDLGTLGGPDSTSSSINDNGQVVGWSTSANGRVYGFVSSNTGLTALTTGSYQSQVRGINNNGQAVGFSLVTNAAFIVDVNTGIRQNLGTISGMSNRNYPEAVNDQGQIIGSISDSQGYGHGYISAPNAGALTLLNTFEAGITEVSAINNTGQVVGKSWTNSGPHAFFTDANGVTLHDLGTLSGHTSEALDINNSGQVVGTYTNYFTGYQGAFVTDTNGQNIQDLTSLLTASYSGWVVAEATAINDKGQIVGMANFQGLRYGILLNPVTVPLPATAWFFLSGLLSLASINNAKKSLFCSYLRHVS